MNDEAGLADDPDAHDGASCAIDRRWLRKAEASAWHNLLSRTVAHAPDIAVLDMAVRQRVMVGQTGGAMWHPAPPQSRRRNTEMHSDHTDLARHDIGQGSLLGNLHGHVDIFMRQINRRVGQLDVAPWI